MFEISSITIIMVVAILAVTYSVKLICEAVQVVSENRKEEAQYKYMEMQIRERLGTLKEEE